MPTKLWAKGQSGNPKGRPPLVESYKHRIQEGLINLLSERMINRGQEQTKFDAFLSNFMEAAIRGDARASETMAKLLFNENTLEDYDNWLNRGREDDVDYRLFKVFKRAFDIQQKIIISKEKRIYVMAGRRSGKTWMNIFKMLYTMIDLAHDTPMRNIKEKPVRCVYCGLTIQKSIDLIYDQFIQICARLLIPVAKERRNEGYIELANGSQLFIAGDASSAEQEKARGPYLDLLILDEIQSHPDARLRYFIESIIEPELIDTKGTLMMTGTGPRTRGMLWSQIWENFEDKWPGTRINWNLYDNPNIEDHETVLQQVLKDHGWTQNSNAFIREYLGKISYDEEALVWRLTSDNYYTKEDLINWINSQPITDIRFTAGLDYGFVSADAFVMVVWSISSPYKYVVSEYKKSRTGWSELIQAVKAKILEVRANPIFDRKMLVAPQDPGWEMTSTLNTQEMQYVQPSWSRFLRTLQSGENMLLEGRKQRLISEKRVFRSLMPINTIRIRQLSYSERKSTLGISKSWLLR